MRLAAVGPVLALLVPLAGCGGARMSEVDAGESRQAAAPREVSLARCAPGEERLLGGARAAYAVSLRRPTAALAEPGGRPLREFGLLNQNGVPTVLGVVGSVLDARCRAAWYRVQLPLRPNGAIGYVRAGDVALHRVRTRIEVDLSARRIDLFRAGRRVLSATAAVGSAATPTPLGRYYVNQRLVPADAAGPFGPAAIGISAFSPVLTGWAQGGPIAIHGTNDPASIGRAVSNGCLRLPNDTIRRLFAAVPAGTPVVIRA